MYLANGDDSLTRWIGDRLPGGGEFGVCRPVAVIGEGDKVLAGVVFHDWRGDNIEISMVAETPRWAHPAIIKQILSYPFNQLGVRRVTCVTDAANTRCSRFLRGIGFVLEGVLRDASERGDMEIYGMLKQEFQDKWERKPLKPPIP